IMFSLVSPTSITDEALWSLAPAAGGKTSEVKRLEGLPWGSEAGKENGIKDFPAELQASLVKKNNVIERTLAMAEYLKLNPDRLSRLLARYRNWASYRQKAESEDLF